jgi:hypothetical protein
MATDYSLVRGKIDRLMKGGISGEVATCDNCGGTYFYSVSVEQFSVGYSSVEYNAVGSNTRQSKICLCGTPLPTKAIARGTAQTKGPQEEYIRSLSAARDYLESNSIKNLAKVATSPSELEDVKKSLTEEISKINTILSSLTSTQNEVPENIIGEVVPSKPKNHKKNE